MKRRALNRKTNKYEVLTHSGKKDLCGQVIWLTEDGKEVYLQSSRHFGKTEYSFFAERAVK
ncbi:MAG: hypothetical protein J6S67_25585 [Methanobrevibacter sp.]|nr:hypothetical protein [Methanobrevibacter sp.]